MEEKKHKPTDEVQKKLNELISKLESSKLNEDAVKMLKKMGNPPELPLSEFQMQLEYLKEETERREREHWEKLTPKVVQQKPIEKKERVSKDYTPFWMGLLVFLIIGLGGLLLYTLFSNEYILYGATILFSIAFIIYKITSRR